MADHIPLHPVPRSTQGRVAYYTNASAAQRHNRYQSEDESSHLDEMPLMMSEEGFENDESDYHTLPRARISQRKRGLEWFVCGGWKFLCTSCCDWLINTCRRKKELKARTVWLGCPEKCEEKYPRNAIKNQKYNIFTFIPGDVRCILQWSGNHAGFLKHAVSQVSMIEPALRQHWHWKVE